MPKTRMNCPQCRQPIIADVEQLFDVGENPQAKQMILSGVFNIAQCANCGYEGNLATPLVYHDPDKELLLTYFPPELGLPVNEQEKLIGPLITRVMNSLPQEKRKAYLFRPQTMLTLQTLVERILEADGITKEMIDAQQKRLELLQRIMTAKDEMIPEIAQSQDELLDADFFNLMGRLIQVAAAGGDQQAAQRLNDLQKILIPLTSFGKEYQAQSREVEETIQILQNAGKDLTREKLLDLMMGASSELRLSVMVSMTRPGLDYEFFQILSERIDQTNDQDQRERLLKLREQLLEMTQKIDQEVQARQAQAHKNIQALVNAEDIQAAVEQNLGAVDEFFLQALQEALDMARKQGDLEQIGKLQQIETVLAEASAPPPEVALIEEFLEVESEAELPQKFEAHAEEITPEFVDAVMGLLAQVQQSGDQELVSRLQSLYQAALRFSMQRNLEI